MRTLPSAPALKPSAVIARSSGASAIATTSSLALAFRTQTAMLSGQSPMSEARGVGFNNRLQEFAAIFDLIRHCSSPQMLAMAYVEACQSVQNAQPGDDGSDR